MHTKRASRRKQSFSGGETGAYKVRRILRDIDEARRYGIQLHTISLNELYSSLKQARKQKNTFEKAHPHNTRNRFVYDPENDEQPPSDDGLDELAYKVQTPRRLEKRATRSKKH